MFDSVSLQSILKGGGNFIIHTSLVDKNGLVGDSVSFVSHKRTEKDGCIAYKETTTTVKAYHDKCVELQVTHDVRTCLRDGKMVSAYTKRRVSNHFLPYEVITDVEVYTDCELS